jgi:hypothetical protein
MATKLKIKNRQKVEKHRIDRNCVNGGKLHVHFRRFVNGTKVVSSQSMIQESNSKKVKLPIHFLIVSLRRSCMASTPVMSSTQ